MLISIIPVAFLALQAVKAHTIFTTLFVNDVNQGDATCIRMNMTPDISTNPINNLAGNEMACSFDGTVGVDRVCPVNQGSKLTFLFRTWADASIAGSIDISHKGPCAVYMKAVASAVEDQGYGDGWFKIWESGYDSATSEWCTEKLIKNNGLLSVNIPDDIVSGYYLVRPELLALHQADKTPPNPQFYTGCAQIFIPSGGSAVPSTVSIPGHVHAEDKSVLFNIYEPKWPYPMPGPAIYKSGTSSKKDVKNRATAFVQTEGLIPAGCVISNGNWCGMELDSYSTEAGCWNASEKCFNQATTCYAKAAPTGSESCRIWEAKCTAIQGACSAGKFNGPPNKGKDLNPPLKAYSIPPAEGPLVAKSIAAPSVTMSTVRRVTQTTAAVAGVYTPITVVSHDGACGAITDKTCLGSPFGNCCSSHGWCGSSALYCGQGCQDSYGQCGMMQRRDESQRLHGHRAD